jgi:P-type Na+/K+ transporter
LLYGIWTAANCIGAFALVVYGWGNGDLGDDCNDRYSERCDTVFRARSTAFICLVWFSLFLAWEVIDLRRSFFRRNAKDPRVWTQWFHDVWRNKFLFWSVVIGWLATFPIIYIPVVNHRLFKHAAISWEWAIVAVSTVLWFSGTELYKLAKRAYFRRYKETDGVVEGDKSLKLFMKYTTPVTTMETDRMKFV